MKSFDSEIPTFPAKDVAALRVRDEVALRSALAEVAPPFSDAMQAELIALGFVHKDAKVRKKAMALVKKHVLDHADFKTHYKSMAGQYQHVVAERVRAFPHRLQVSISRAIFFHRRMAGSLAFEHDAKFRQAVLAEMVAKAKREKESCVELGKVYWYWKQQHGWSTDFDHHALSPKLFAELAKLRTVHPFDGISLHGGSLRDLPKELKKAKPWLEELDLTYNPFDTVPSVVFELSNLKRLSLCGTDLTDISDDISKLKKLRSLDIGNGRKMKAIPASVCALGQLGHLRIGNGSIRKIPEAISGMKSLQVFEMSSTNIQKVPKGLGELPKLKKIVMHFCRLDTATVKAVVGSKVQVVG